VLFALGGVLTTPTQQTVAASLANPAALGSYFGVNSLALGIGGGMGNLSGGLLYDLGARFALPDLPWLVFCLVGLLSSLGLALMALRQRRVKEIEVQQPAVSLQQ
jgi:DHA1 family multidrug resistance protein-like MFS transporter